MQAASYSAVPSSMRLGTGGLSGLPVSVSSDSRSSVLPKPEQSSATRRNTACSRRESSLYISGERRQEQRFKAARFGEMLLALIDRGCGGQPSRQAA